MLKRVAATAAFVAVLLATGAAFGAPTATIDFVQGANNPPAGQALSGVTGTLVSISNASNTLVASWQIELIDVPPASGLTTGLIASTNSGSTPTASFTPDATGSYRVALKVWNLINRPGAPTDTDIRDVMVGEPNTGLIVPPYQTWPRSLPPLASGLAGAKATEMNLGGVDRGWDGSGSDGLLRNLIKLVDSLLPTAGQKQALSGTSGTPASGNRYVTDGDARNSNARTPTTHATTHESAGSDAIPLDTLAAPTDITTLNASTSAHGLMKKLSGTSTDCFIGTGTFVACLTAVGASTAGTNMLQAASAKAQAALWNAYLPVHGTIGDADTTVNVSTASQYTMATVTANRVVTFGVSGSPVSGVEVMRVDVTRTSAFAVTFKDDAATTLAVCPASVPCSVVVKHDGTHFANPSLVRIQ